MGTANGRGKLMTCGRRGIKNRWANQWTSGSCLQRFLARARLVCDCCSELSDANPAALLPASAAPATAPFAAPAAAPATTALMTFFAFFRTPVDFFRPFPALFFDVLLADFLAAFFLAPPLLEVFRAAMRTLSVEVHHSLHVHTKQRSPSNEEALPAVDDALAFPPGPDWDRCIYTPSPSRSMRRTNYCAANRVYECS